MDSPVKAKTILDNDSGLGSDTDSWFSTDKNGTREQNPRATTLNEFPGSKVCQISTGTSLRLAPHEAAGNQLTEGTFIKEPAEFKKQTYEKNCQRILSRDLQVRMPRNLEKCQIKLRTPELNSAYKGFVDPMSGQEMPSLLNNERRVRNISTDCIFQERGKRMIPLNEVPSNSIEPDKTNKAGLGSDAILSTSKDFRQLRVDGQSLTSAFKTKRDMFSSQISLSSISKSPDVSTFARGDLKCQSKFNTFKSEVQKNDKKQAVSSFKSEVNLSKYRRCVSVQPDNLNECLSTPKNKKSASTEKNHSIKNRNPLNLRLVVSGLSDIPRESLSTSSFGSLDTITPPDKHSHNRKYAKVKSLDSTPQSAFEFNTSSLPLPEKKRKSSFSALKKFFSLRPKSSASAVQPNMKCRRKLFSDGDVIHEGTSFDVQPREITPRFAKNKNSGQVWLTNTPRSAPTITNIRSQPTTPTKDLQAINSSDPETAQDPMKVVLSVFANSFKLRIIKELQQLDCTEVKENSRFVPTENSFDHSRKEYLTNCQKLLASFKDLSLSLLSLRCGLIKMQTVYYKNSELYVQHLEGFVDSSRTFIGVVFASRVKYQLKTMSKEVAKEGFVFLESSHDCVTVARSGADEAYKILNEQFNNFSAKFEKLIKWTKELEYGDTVSILW